MLGVRLRVVAEDSRTYPDNIDQDIPSQVRDGARGRGAFGEGAREGSGRVTAHHSLASVQILPTRRYAKSKPGYHFSSLLGCWPDWGAARGTLAAGDSQAEACRRATTHMA